MLCILASNVLYKSCKEGFSDVYNYKDFTACYNMIFFINSTYLSKGDIDFISSYNLASILNSKGITIIVFYSSAMHRVSKVSLGLLSIFRYNFLIAITFFLIIKVYNNAKVILLY